MRTPPIPVARVAKVEFFQGATLIATINAPNLFTFTVNNLAAGNYSFTARATDNLGAQTTSSAATVTVSTNLPPSVNLTAPAAQSVYAAPANITITGTAGDTDGTVTQIQLFANGSPIATLPGTSPFSFNWTNVAAGSYALTARAIDNTNAATTSGSVNVTVNPNQPPSVTLTSPTNNASFAAPATITLTATAADTDGTIASVQLLNGAGVVATLTSPPYTFTLTNVTAGSYTFTAKATDNNGAITTSAAANVTVTGVTATAVYYIYTDQLNTPRAITNEAATPVWKWDNTDPFGANAANEDPDGDTNKFVFNLRFPGQYFDKETDTHYNIPRITIPPSGDTSKLIRLGSDGGINTYAYVGGNPLKSVDLRGLRIPRMGQQDFFRASPYPQCPVLLRANVSRTGFPPISASPPTCCSWNRVQECTMSAAATSGLDCSRCAVSRGRDRLACLGCLGGGSEIAGCFRNNCAPQQCNMCQ